MALAQPQQVRHEAQPLLLSVPRQLLVTGPEGWQVQLLQIRCQPLLHVLVLLHRRPPCHPVRRHTGSGPRPPPLPRWPAVPGRADATSPPRRPHPRGRPLPAVPPRPPPRPPPSPVPPRAESAGTPLPLAPAL